jgi:hypothetical protein
VESHGGYAIPAMASVYLYMEFVNSSDIVIHREQLSTGYAYGATSRAESYVAAADVFSPTGYSFVFGSGPFSFAAGAYNPTPDSPKNFQVNFPVAGNYRARYSTRISVTSGYGDSVNADGSRSYNYPTFSKAGVSFSSLDTNIDLIFPTNFVELSAGGFQAVTDSSQYVQINRLDSPTTTSSPTLVRINNGSLSIYQNNDIAFETLYNQGRSSLTGRVAVGGDWSGDLTKPKTLDVNGGLVLNSYPNIPTGGSSASPTDLGPILAQGYSFIMLDSTSTSDRHYVLPYYRDASNNTANYDKFRKGHIAILFNRDDNNNEVYVKGLLEGGTGYNQIGGGSVWWLIYSGPNNDLEGPAGVNGWILMSLRDNNW